MTDTDKMGDVNTTEVPLEQKAKEETASTSATGSTGDVQIENASPQVPAQQETKIPEVATHTKSKTLSKFDPSDLPDSSDPAEIKKQVEFYFSDSNLPLDKFLWKVTTENSGWVPISTIAGFKRMRRFKPFEAVVEALKTSEMLMVDDIGEKVKRREELRLDSNSGAPTATQRSVYLKGFGEETKTTQIDLENWFAQFGEIKVVRLRRTDEGSFKGSVFVEFKTLEQQKAFLELDPKPKYNDTEMDIMSKLGYIEMKDKQYGGNFPQKDKRPFNGLKEQKKNKESERRDRGGDRGGRGGRGGRGSNRGRGGRGGRGDNKRERGDDRNAEREEKEQKKAKTEGADTAQDTSAPATAPTTAPASEPVKTTEA